ncbi:Gfo/Idh/MocA family oxidoreductase [Siccirubricoccus sp. KC 17139]|uniref:Gfo/Idh/MocA family oxidoreductase n=1 Tax=Siccirubricoccus soli TaxID=2899147 RepID=A0ABT1D303_9PROT|nr:Gfo/Idh/MocA family oxidoreductase [Siccirubricoccus soli]MCO6416306.1 Gfo/Idh/MocA family oxidoreductase [Siccirubricoccus soli]MCP2682440.1 Gfo/Idh/MocA family oxidoreductase [Siccirubricoccus soli]
MLQAAIVGMGRWGQVLVESVQGRNDAGLRFVAGATRTPAKAAAWAAAKGIRLLPDYAAVLADPEVQAVVLATPHSQHAEQIIAAAAAGKHVFVEKPFTLSKASAEAAVAACAKAGVVLALGHNRRFLPATLEMKRLLAEGALGTVTHAEGHISGPGAFEWQEGMWRADREESPLGGMGAMGIHMIDMLINLMGPFAAVKVESFARLSSHVDDTTAMLARFVSGATCNFATLSLSPRYWRVALFGTAAILEMRGQEQLVFTPLKGQGWIRDFPKTDIEAAELAAFAAAVAGGPAYPLPLEDAVHGIAVFDAMKGAAASGSSHAVG